MINSPFFTQFLKVSNYITIIAITALLLAIFVLNKTKEKKVSFSNRMLIGLLLGLIIGFVIDFFGVNNAIYTDQARAEISLWYSLVGSGFVRLVQLMAIPVVFLSIIKVVIDTDGKRIQSLTSKTFVTLLSTTAISAVVGILVVKLFRLEGANFMADLGAARIDRIAGIAAQSFPEFFLNLVPSNIFSVMSNNGSIVSVVIIAAMLASAMRFLVNRKPQEVKPLIDVLDALRLTINSTLINIIKLMPYGVIALVANAIISNGINAIVGVIGFIVAIYVGIIIMMILYMFMLMALGLNPATFYKKAYSTIVFGFSSRSSVGTLPYTIKTLTEDLGVSDETANFVATLGTSIGMNGCAGVFPAMLATIVAAAVGVTMNLTFFTLLIVVVAIGSIGIAGVPGTATVSATVVLNALGLGAAMEFIGSILGIDPIIDMGRTALNVTGAMVAAIIVDNLENTFNREVYNQ